jgi:hypothetical protein
MVKRRTLNRWTAQLGAELDALARSDSAAYEIAYALVQDFVRVQNGHWNTMEGGQGQTLHDRASPALQKRAVAMFGRILRLTTSEFEQGAVSEPPPRPGPTKASPGKPGKRRWRRK